MRRLIVRMCLTIVLLVVLLPQVELAEVGAVLMQTRPGWMALAVVANLIALIAIVWRWQIIIAGMGAPQSFRNLLHVNLVSTFFGMFLPSSVGGDVMKMIMIAGGASQREAAASSVVIDRVIGMAVTLVISALALLFLPVVWGNHTVLGALAATAILVSLGIAIIFSRRLFRLITLLAPRIIWRKIEASVARAHQSVINLRNRVDILVYASLVSLFRQIAISLSIFFAGKSFGIDGDVAIYFVIIPIVMAVTALPISINGLGLQDNAMVLLFGIVGVNSAEALSLSIFMHVTRSLTGIVGGLFFAFGSRHHTVSLSDPSASRNDSHERDCLQSVQ